MKEKIRMRLPSTLKVISEKAANDLYDHPEFNEFKASYKRLIVRSKAFWSIEWFAQNITKRWTASKKTKKKFPTPQFHKDLWEICLDGQDVIVICPRGFAKSTAISKILVLWLLCFQLEPSILLISSKDLGESIIGDIRRELEENALLQMLFGALVPVDHKLDNKIEKWRQKELQLLNGTELKTLSKGQSVRGQRPTLILIDDPEENKNVKNPIIAEEFFSWVDTTVIPALDDGGNIFVLGTIISSNCFINTLKAKADERNYKVFEYPAIVNFDKEKIKKKYVNNIEQFYFDEGIGESLWPERWGLDKLAEKLNKMGMRAWLQEYMNIPFILNGSPVFDPEISYIIKQPLYKLHEFDWFIDIKNNQGIYNGFIGVDLANGGVNGDYTVAKIRDEQYKLIAEYRGHITQDRLAHILTDIIPQFKDIFIVVENNNALAFFNEAKQFDWYWKLYRKRTMDKVTNKETEILGWNTNAKTKSLLINDFDKILRLGDLEVSQINYDELTHYYYDEKGGMNAISPWHDDTVIADALCNQAIKHGLLAPQLIIF